VASLPAAMMVQACADDVAASNARSNVIKVAGNFMAQVFR